MFGESKILSWLEKEVVELEYFSSWKLRLWTGRAEVFRSNGISLSTANLFTTVSSFSCMTCKLFHALLQNNLKTVKSLCQNSFDLEELPSMFTAYKLKNGATPVLEANFALLDRETHSPSDISNSLRYWKRTKSSGYLITTLSLKKSVTYSKRSRSKGRWDYRNNGRQLKKFEAQDAFDVSW